MYHKWLQNYVSRYGIDLTGWTVTLEKAESYPRKIGGYRPSKMSLYACNPQDDTVEIIVDDIWLDEQGDIIQHGKINLG